MNNKLKKEIKNAILVIQENNTTVFTIFLLTLLIEILFVASNSDFHTFGILAFYIGMVLVFKLTSRMTYLLCLSLLILMFFIFIFTGVSNMAEKAAVFLVLFWLVGLIQQWKE